MPSYKFPSDFLWGTASSAHQTEGNNTNSDWWQWEQNKSFFQKYPLEASEIACDSYHRYEEDFNLCKRLNNNAVRISIEWARIEPVEGKFDHKELEHYKKVLHAAQKRGLKTLVTLHHFTSPLWFARKGGWESLKSSYRFARYAKKCAHELGELINFFITINEPQVYIMQSYLNKMWPPNKANPLSGLLVQANLISAHRKAYDEIKKILPKAQIGISKNIEWFETKSRSILDRLAVKILYFIGSDFFLKPLGRRLDFIGLNYYFTSRIKNFKSNNPNDWISDLNWWLYPEGLKQTLINLKRYKLPVYITENGLADANDKHRIRFIKEMLKACADAIEQGGLLKGYFHWTLVDNYEWHHGYWPKFGLVEIDRKDNLKRQPRKSFYYYAKVCKENGLVM